MPIKSENKNKYPKNWKEISIKIRTERANNKCEFCEAENYQPHPITKSKVILTVAHLDHNPENCSEENLKALCQKCHLNYDLKYHIENRKITIAKRKYQKMEMLFQ